MAVAGAAPDPGGQAGGTLKRAKSAPVDPALLATADQLDLRPQDASPEKYHRGSGVPPPWTSHLGSGGEFATFVYEEDLSEETRDDFAFAAGVAAGALEKIWTSTLSAGLPGSSSNPSFQAASQPFHERLRQAVPLENVRQPVDWSRLAAADSTDALRQEEDAEASGGKAAARVEINSGGQVFFGLLSPRSGSGCEEAVVVKFCNSRHLLQSEQVAAELAWHLELRVPASRLLLRAHDGEEWRALAAAAEAVRPELAELMGRKQSMLLLNFVPGRDLQTESAAWAPGRLPATATELGRLLVLDILLGNSDRLPVRSMMWRGNPSNVLFRAPQDEGGGHCVPIDAAVARRPPKLLVHEMDRKAAELLELVLLDRRSCHEVLLDVVSCNEEAVAAVEADWADSEAQWLGRRPPGAPAPAGRSAVSSFHAGLQAALDLALSEQGLLEMMVDVLQDWMANFKADMSEFVPSAGPPRPSNTGLIKSVDKQASKSEEVRDRLDAWQDLLQKKTIALSRAVGEWSARHRAGLAPLAFRGFLGESVLNPVADAYELLVRLRQLVARGKVMGEATESTRPADLAPHPLFVGPATSASCFHLMRRVGITAILNCTEDLPEPSEEALGGIRWRRLALADVEEQDLGAALESGLRFIDEVKADNGRVLVHCHEGKSRSVSVCLAYLMTRERMPLAKGLSFVKDRRKQARPNAGFMKQLSDLELRELGSRSVSAADMPKGKPKMRVCEVCGQPAGLSEESLAAHMRSKHPS